MCIVVLLFGIILYVCLSVSAEYGAFAGIMSFIGIFAIIFWISEENQKKQNAKKQAIEEWKEKVIDPVLEAQIDDRRKHIDTNTELIEEAKRFYFSEISPDYRAMCFNIDEKDIILAKHGKLSQRGSALYGISIAEPGYSYRYEESEYIIKEQHKAVRWIDKQLRAFGVDADLYFSSDDRHYFPAYEAKDTECGTYRWSPTIADHLKFYCRAAAENAINKK